MEDEKRHIPNRLRKFRRIMGYSQKDVAFLLGFKSSERIHKWETGEAFPSISNVLKLSIVYRTLINDLYFDEQQEIRQQLHEREKVLRNKKQ